MIGMIIIGSILGVAVGAVIKIVLDRRGTEERITWVEFVLGCVIVVLVISPAVAMAGRRIAIDQLTEYNETWSGYESAYRIVSTQCHRDGSCRHHYQCDPYQVKVVDRAAYTDDDGVYHPEVSHMETRYHRCPYVTVEYTYVIDTTLGSTYTIASHHVPDDADNHRWRAGVAVPRNLPRGVPEQWLDARARIDAGTPGPVAERHTYKNLILASQTSLGRRYSGAIESYVEAGVMPAINTAIRWPYYQDRVYFVGVSAVGDWAGAINAFNAALGTDLQGDLHLVIVDANRVRDPDEYIMAIIAYWQSPRFGKDALSKNGIIVVCGTVDGVTCLWGRAATGMPKGNEAMIGEVSDRLQGVSITPLAMLGTLSARPYIDEEGEREIEIVHSPERGILEEIFWGANGFVRQCMLCEGDEDEGAVGYSYLVGEIQPTTGQQVLIVVATVFASLIIWGVFVFVGIGTVRRINVRSFG